MTTIYRLRLHLKNDLIGSDHILSNFDDAMLFLHNFIERHGDNFHVGFLVKMELCESTGVFVPVDELKFT